MSVDFEQRGISDNITECRQLAVSIMLSFSMSKDVSNILLREHTDDFLFSLLPLIDVKDIFPDKTYEETLRTTAITALNYNIQQMTPQDILLLKVHTVYERLQKVLTYHNTQSPAYTFAKNILQWYDRYEADRLREQHERALLGGKWVAPLDSTLFRLKIPIELRRLIKRYLYHPLKNMTISNAVQKWQFSDPFDTYCLHGNISEWDTSQVTSMWQLFRRATYSTSLDKHFNEDIELWDVSNVKSLKGMFERAMAFNKPLNLWCVDNVEDMAMMFEGATHFNQPLDKWNVRKVKTFKDMFKGATAFNQSLDMWEISNQEEAIKLGVMSG
jgi:hypothetical protein